MVWTPPATCAASWCQSRSVHQTSHEEESTMDSTTIAVDLAKSVFELAVSHRAGVIARHHRFTRVQFVAFFANAEPATFVMEACGSAHYWGRQLHNAGHRVVLLPPHMVRPYAP